MILSHMEIESEILYRTYNCHYTVRAHLIGMRDYALLNDFIVLSYRLKWCEADIVCYFVISRRMLFNLLDTLAKQM